MTTIGKGAFSNCKALSDVQIGKNVSFIEEAAFYYCESMKELILPNSVTVIGEYAFRSCYALQSIEIPDSVTQIGMYAFFLCKDLISINIPDSLIELAVGTFNGCESLETVDIPKKVSKIGERAFAGCTALRSVNIPDSVITIEQGVFKGCKNLISCNIPESVTSIEQGAFADCEGITEITLPCGLTEIAKNEFANCSNLTKVVIPRNIKTIKEGAFNNCSLLSDIYYTGSMEQWEDILLEDGNIVLLTATIHPNWGCEHSETIVLPAVAATCEATGLTEGAKCAKCGEVVKAQKEVAALDHNYEENILNVPTCTQYGMAKYICKNDENHFYVDAVDPIPHDYDFVSGVCTVCGAEDPDHVANPFTDVADDAWYAAPVLWAFNNNVTGGTSATTFGPDAGCTRAQVVTFLWAANGKPEPKSMDNPFSDVANDAWYLKPVLWAVEQGITTGINATEFGPTNTCTRAQIATFLYAAAGKPEVKGSSIFDDVADDAWYAKPVIWAVENDVTSGIGEGKFGPANTCTRAQVVTFLYKVYG